METAFAPSWRSRRRGSTAQRSPSRSEDILVVGGNALHQPTDIFVALEGPRLRTVVMHPTCQDAETEEKPFERLCNRGLLRRASEYDQPATVTIGETSPAFSISVLEIRIFFPCSLGGA